MKFGLGQGQRHPVVVAPARGRGLKYDTGLNLTQKRGRPRKGAWIEISTTWVFLMIVMSPPQGGVD